ncbi:MAG: pilus assembly protein [Alphaproteobacteria bacterium]|nr:pilus assembly protein [Alphaproteobacteria bacterium]
MRAPTMRLNAKQRRTGAMRRDRSGSAAIEFALIAPVLFVFLMGIIETGVIFFAQFVLQNAVNDAARQIRTGQVAASAMTQAQFRALVCSEIGPVMGCGTNLQIDVESYNGFSGANFGNPLTAGNTLDPTLDNWLPGTYCSIVLVRVFYTWDVVTPLLTPFLSNMANNQHLIAASAAFRNEPYSTGVAGC